jgi:hypothetical protein
VEAAYGLHARQWPLEHTTVGSNLTEGDRESMTWGAHASSRAISGVSPESLFGETPNTIRVDAYALQNVFHHT